MLSQNWLAWATLYRFDPIEKVSNMMGTNKENGVKIRLISSKSPSRRMSK